MDEPDAIFENSNVNTSVRVKVPERVPDKKKKNTGSSSGAGTEVTITSALLKKPKTDERKDEKKDDVTLEDLQACAWVAKFGAASFRKLEETITEKSNTRLRGKISSFESHNRYLDGELIRTSRELKIYQDRNLVELSEENQELKAKLKNLSRVQNQLDKALAKVGEQSKKITAIPELEAGLMKAQEEP